MKWAYGVMTVPRRREDLLPRTLESLRSGGFDQPRLFVDGADSRDYLWYRERFPGLEVTTHWPHIRTYGNWILAVAELYIRNPVADRYAMFQDDFVTYKNLRGYLEKCKYPDCGYWNLYTFPANQGLCPKNPDNTEQVGWYASNQFGRGAVALVFSLQCLLTLLTYQEPDGLAHKHMVERPMDCTRGWRSVDGGVVTALKKAGYSEYVHNPSLVQHTGIISSMNNRPHKLAISFKGEDFDALSLLNQRP